MIVDAGSTLILSAIDNTTFSAKCKDEYSLEALLLCSNTTAQGSSNLTVASGGFASFSSNYTMSGTSATAIIDGTLGPEWWYIEP